MQELIKIEKKLRKIYLTYYKLLKAQDVWQAHYQIFSIIFLNKFIELNKKFYHDNKKCETCGIKYTYSDCFLEYIGFKDDLLGYKCLCCNKNYQQKFDEKIKERFFNTYRFSNHDNNK